MSRKPDEPEAGSEGPEAGSDEPSRMSREPDENSGDDASSLMSATRQYAHYATAGIMFPVSIALGFGFGYLIDRWAGTTPLFALVGMALGIAAAIRNLLQVAARDDDV